MSEELDRGEARQLIDGALRPCLNLLDSRDAAGGTGMSGASFGRGDATVSSGGRVCLCSVTRHPPPAQPPNVSEFKGDGRFLRAVKQLQTAHRSRPNWLQKVGQGIVCVREGGIEDKSLVGYYWGKLYECCRAWRSALTHFRRAPSQWLEDEQHGGAEFYNLYLEVPACSSGGYYLL